MVQGSRCPGGPRGPWDPEILAVARYEGPRDPGGPRGSVGPRSPKSLGGPKGPGSPRGLEGLGVPVLGPTFLPYQIIRFS